MKTRVLTRTKKSRIIMRWAVSTAVLFGLFCCASAQEAPSRLGISRAKETPNGRLSNSADASSASLLPDPSTPLGDMTYQGGAIMPTANITAIFWGNGWANYTGDKIAGIDSFYQGFSGSNYAKTSDEYTGKSGQQVGSTTNYWGHIIDTSFAADGTDSNEILNEVCRVIYPTYYDFSGNGYYPVYVDRPRAINGSACGWHTSGVCQIPKVGGGYLSVPMRFALISNLDGDANCDPGDDSGLHSQGLAAIAGVSAHEFSEARTDPDINAWYEPGVDSNGNPTQAENGDKCAWTFGAPLVTLSNGTQWKLQGEWSNNARDHGTGYPNRNGELGCLSGGLKRTAVLDGNGNLWVKEGDLSAAWTWESWPVKSFALEGSRIGVLENDGTLYVKEGPLDAAWTWESSNVQSFALAGNRIGVLNNSPDHTVYVKEGPLTAGWTAESWNVQTFALEGNRIGVLNNSPDHTLYVKEGPLTAGWTAESSNVQSFVLKGNRIGVLNNSPDHTLWVKEGSLTAGWTAVHGNVRSFTLEGNQQGDPDIHRIGVLDNFGNLWVTESPLTPGGALVCCWIGESGSVQSFAMSGDRIGVLDTSANHNVFVKEGPLTAGWTWESSNVQSFALQGDRIGVLDSSTNHNVFVKEGPLAAGWTWESWTVQSFALSD